MQIIVLGMHRSGTSLVTRLLNLMGVYLGEGPDLLPGQPDNPKGFWERSDVQQLHEEMLSRFDSAWFDITGFNAKHADNAVRQEFEDKANRILSILEPHRPWAIKDPRLCLFFPWWARLLEAPVVIYVVRAPWEVAASLRKRNGFPLAVGAAIWELYNRHALEAVRRFPVIRLNLENLVKDPQTESLSLHQLLRQNGLTGIRRLNYQEVEAFFDPSLIHFHNQQEDGSKVMTLSQQELWEGLSGEASPAEISVPPVPEAANDLIQGYFRLEKRTRALETRQETLQQEICNLKKDLKQEAKEHELVQNSLLAAQESCRALEQEENRLQESLQAEQKAAREEICRLQAEYRSLEKSYFELERSKASLAEDLNKRIDSLRQELLDVYNSRTWRWGQRLFGPPAALYRKLKSWIRRPGFLLSGTALSLTEEENTDPVSAQERNKGMPVLGQTLRRLYPAPRYPGLALTEPIDIIIPVYNGFEYLDPLFESLFANTSLPFRLIIVNDCSTDARVRPLLSAIADKDSRVELIENQQNRGFVQSVNLGAAKANNHFVLLNTDVEVPPLWLERLIWPIVHRSGVATATPFTNAGTICSFPHFPEESDIIGNLSCSSVDWGFAHINPEGAYYQMPTGVGFCMAVNHKAWQRIGPFDAETFGAGYGEENDWCLRAANAGFSNVLVPNLFVYHKNGGSFAPEDKIAFSNNNLEIINKRYPNYGSDVQAYIQYDPAKWIRDIALVLISANYWADRVVLIVDHCIGGGANHYRKELVQEYIKKRQTVLLLSFDSVDGSYLLRYIHSQEIRADFSLEQHPEMDGLFDYISIDEILVNNLVTFPDPTGLLEYLCRLRARFKAGLFFYLHDYFALCPSHNLLDAKGNYCGLKSVDNCAACLHNHPRLGPKYQQTDITRWRSSWMRFLWQCEKIICFSQASCELVQKVYPALDGTMFDIIPHQIQGFDPLSPRPRHPGPWTIAVIGVLDLHKGADVVREMDAIIRRQDLALRIVLIGWIPSNILSFWPLESSVQVTGAYEHADLPRLVQEYKVDMALIPSIWPETFSYTTQECILMDIPVAVFDLGAPAERVRQYPKGLVIEKIDADSALDKILDYLQNNNS